MKKGAEQTAFEELIHAHNKFEMTFADYRDKVVANNDFGLIAQGLPLGSTGYFICSPNQAQVANPGGSVGTLCVGAPTGRYLSQVGNSGIFGIIPLVVDLTAVPQPTGNVAVLPGETWNFQCWYRDSLLGIPVSNFTDGYTITFE